MIKIQKGGSLAGGFWFTACSGNGAVLATSETYTSYQNVRRAVRSFVLAMGIDTPKILDYTGEKKVEIQFSDL